MKSLAYIALVVPILIALVLAVIILLRSKKKQEPRSIPARSRKPARYHSGRPKDERLSSQGDEGRLRDLAEKITWKGISTSDLDTNGIFLALKFLETYISSHSGVGPLGLKVKHFLWRVLVYNRENDCMINFLESGEHADCFEIRCQAENRLCVYIPLKVVLGGGLEIAGRSSAYYRLVKYIPEGKRKHGTIPPLGISEIDARNALIKMLAMKK